MSSHASRIWAAEPASIESMAPTGIESRSPARALDGGDAHALFALTTVNLLRSRQCVEQRLQNRAGGGEQALILTCGGGELGETRAQYEAAVLGSRTTKRWRSSAIAQSRCAGRAREVRRRDELTERCGAGLERIENLYGLVEHADAGMNLVVVCRHIVVIGRIVCARLSRRSRFCGKRI